MAQDAHRNCSPSRTSDSRSQRSHTTSASFADTSALSATHAVHRKSLPLRTFAVPPQRSQRSSRPPFDVDRGFGCIVGSFPRFGPAPRCGRPNAPSGRTRDRSRARPGRISRGVRPAEQGGRGRMRERWGTATTRGRGRVAPASPVIRALARRACLATSTRAGCGSNQARSAPTGQSPGRVRSSAIDRPFGRTRWSARRGGKADTERPGSQMVAGPSVFRDSCACAEPTALYPLRPPANPRAPRGGCPAGPPRPRTRSRRRARPR
jgi:hypothetical protein